METWTAMLALQFLRSPLIHGIWGCRGQLGCLCPAHPKWKSSSSWSQLTCVLHPTMSQTIAWLSEWGSQLYLGQCFETPGSFLQQELLLLGSGFSCLNTPTKLKTGTQSMPWIDFTAHPKQTAWSGVTQGWQSLSKSDLGIKIVSPD